MEGNELPVSTRHDFFSELKVKFGSLFILTANHYVVINATATLQHDTHQGCQFIITELNDY